MAVASCTVRPARSGTFTSRARRATRMAAAAKMTKVPSSAAASTSSFPAPHTRVLNNMQPAKVLQVGRRLQGSRRMFPARLSRHSGASHADGAEERLQPVLPGPGAKMAGLVDQVFHGGGKPIHDRLAGQRGEAGVTAQEGGDNLLVLLGLARACRI